MRVNVSRCDDNDIDYTSRQGVVYGVCHDLTTFCKMHVQTHFRTQILVFVRRLFYQCESMFWRAGIFKVYRQKHDRNSHPVVLKCDCHSLDEMYFGLNSNWIFIDSINNPPIKVLIEVVKSLRVIVKYASEYSGQRCNQYSDCLNDSDEAECQHHVDYPDVYTHYAKKQRFFVDLDGAGYFTARVMADNESCLHSQYSCTGGFDCLPFYTWCNGYQDCAYADDEQDCETTQCPGFYQCQASRACVHVDHLCDGWGQCPRRDDELICDRTCPEVLVMTSVTTLDVMAWCVFGLVTVIRSHGVGVFGQIHDAMVVFVLPLNAALSPVLYMWTIRSQWRQQQVEEKLLTVLKLRLSQAGKNSVVKK
ncbi:hypothetical protein ACOMHN_012901 [Nucella lapillus]